MLCVQHAIPCVKDCPPTRHSQRRSALVPAAAASRSPACSSGGDAEAEADSGGSSPRSPRMANDINFRRLEWGDDPTLTSLTVDFGGDCSEDCLLWRLETALERGNRHLRELTLANIPLLKNGRGKEKIAPILDPIIRRVLTGTSNLPSLTRLCLLDLKDKEAASYVRDAISHLQIYGLNGSVQELHLSFQDSVASPTINAGCQCVFAGLSCQESCRDLSGIVRSGGQRLVKIGVDTPPASLNTEAHRLHPVTVGKIAEALRYNSILEEIHLVNIEISPMGLLSLLRVLEKDNFTLKHLRFDIRNAASNEKLANMLSRIVQLLHENRILPNSIRRVLFGDVGDDDDFVSGGYGCVDDTGACSTFLSCVLDESSQKGTERLYRLLRRDPSVWVSGMKSTFTGNHRRHKDSQDLPRSSEVLAQVTNVEACGGSSSNMADDRAQTAATTGVATATSQPAVLYMDSGPSEGLIRKLLALLFPIHELREVESY